MKLRTLIIDDEPIALEKLRTYVSKVPFLQLAGECMSGLEAAERLAAGDIDVIFTDINMPDFNGLELIGSLAVQPLVVFISAYSEYAVESYRVSAVDYLLKPYGFVDFQRAASKVLSVWTSRHPAPQAVEPAPIPARPDSDSLFIKVDYRFVRVILSSIRYIKGYGEYLQIYLVDNPAPLLTLSSFSAIASRLGPEFLQVHRSYIVNMNHVAQIVRGRLVMDADTYIPVGDSYRPALQAWLSSRSVGSR